MKFDRYGLHRIEGDIALLVQEGGVSHVLGVPMNFDVMVKTPRQGLRCPHNVILTDGMDGDLPDDPLVRAMLPVPKEFGEPTLYVESTNENKKLVRELLRLSSSPFGEMKPIWFGNEQLASAHLHITNLSPLVLFGYSTTHMWLVRKVLEASFYAPRRLIMIGPNDVVMPGEVERIKPTITADDILSLPLEGIGAETLKQHMLRQR